MNPPGNETVAAELLRDYLAANGVSCELYSREPHRANLVARIEGGDGPSLAFLSHTDTVLADPAEWDRDPWSGDLVDGEVWGRGALDMKGQAAASAVAFASLAREDHPLTGDLVLLLVADEEVGGLGGHEGYGLRWLVQAHPEAARCDYAINEGGGDRLVLGGNPVYVCATAEKMSSPFTVRVRGRSGHASMPGIADNALVKAARYVEALGRTSLRASSSPRRVASSRPSSARRRRSRRRSLAPRRSIRCCPPSRSRCSRSRSRRR